MQRHLTRTAPLLLLLTGVLALFPSGEIRAQPILTPKTLGLGGGGAAYITGYASNFYNPANLMIQERSTTRSFGLVSTATQYEPVFNNQAIGTRARSFLDTFRPYDFSQPELTPDEQHWILNQHYDNQALTRTFTSRFDAILFGIKWRSGSRAYSLALRSRAANSFTVGRGWYSGQPLMVNDRPLVDRTLTQQIQAFHELSIGYAETFSFVNGLSPSLSHLYIGIAPKFVVGGMHMDATYRSHYIQSPDDGQIFTTQGLDYYSAGDLGITTISQFDNGNIRSPVARNLNDGSLFNPSGYGLGLDFGLTYLFTIGNDLSTSTPGNPSPTNQSVRLSFSITDIGYISYGNHPVQVQSPTDTLTASNYPNAATKAYTGAPSQFTDFLKNQLSPSPAFSPLSNEQQQSYTNLLPTALHGGLLIQLNRIKLMADLNYGLTDNAFSSRKITAHAGAEFYPFDFLPIRVGGRLKHKHTPLISLGTGVETLHWELSLSAMFAPPNEATFKEPYGAGAATLQFHF